jgi:hypothetical protein
VLVADTRNHRVLVFDRRSAGADAIRVLGQTGFDAAAPGLLEAPEGAAFDGVRLAVADTAHHRVLVWNTFPTANGAPPDLILGQSGLDGTSPNRGGAPTSATLFLPTQVMFARGALWIADSGNNRVLRFDAIPTSSGAAASAVFGQRTFDSRIPATDARELTALGGPVALAHDDAFAYVLDRDLGRVVRWPLGAPSGEPALDAQTSASGLALSSPAGLAVERTPLFTSRLHVADTASSRVVVVTGLTRLISRK